MKIVFDIDGTICSNTWGKYADARPYKEMIALVNQLYDEGNTIVFYSARGFGSCAGRIMEIYATWYDFTYDQMTSWGVKFHQLVLGKPDGAVYVDDRGLGVTDDGSDAESIRRHIYGIINKGQVP